MFAVDAQDSDETQWHGHSRPTAELLQRYNPVCVAAWAYVVAAVLMGMTAVSTVQPADWSVPGTLRVGRAGWGHGILHGFHAACRCAGLTRHCQWCWRRGDDRTTDILDPRGFCSRLLPPHGGHAIPPGQSGKLGVSCTGPKHT